MKDTNIISITDIIENKVRKQKELEGYEAQLDDLKRKKFWIEKEIQMAEFIISAVQSEITPQQFIKALINAELEKDE
jgi:hypothetical protein